MTRLLAINGSYRDDGITDQVVEIMLQVARESGAEAEIVLLRDYPIEFCLNCRECMQAPGEVPGVCVHHDNMQNLVDRIERADAFVLASPTNLGSVTAVFKRFMERLAVYAYWPWGNNAPQFRKSGSLTKKAVLISSCAAPGFIGRWLYASHGQLKMTAKVIGANPVGSMFTGMIAKQPDPRLSPLLRAKAAALTERLL